MKNKILLLSTALTLAGGYITYDYLTHHKSEKSKHGHHDEHSENKSPKTKINKEVAKNLKIEIEQVSPQKIEKKIQLYGIINLNPNKSAQVKARFSGVVKEVKKDLNDPVKKGDVLAMVEGNDSLQIYPVTSPVDGVVIERDASIGEVTSDKPLFVVADLSSMMAEFSIFSKDIEAIKKGQKIYIQSKDKKYTIESNIAGILQTTEASSQTVIARAFIDNTQNNFRSGMSVKGQVVIDEKQVPLAVKINGIQKIDNQQVIFIKSGETYKAKNIELGESDDVYAEIIDGVKNGEEYVSKNSFIIRADIEKSEAEHEH